MAEKDDRPLDYLKDLPTDGNKITPKMLDSKADLQDLIDGAEMFRARPPMPDDGTLYEWDVDFGWIEAELEEHLPLQVIRAPYWTDFPDGRRRRCAELLVRPSVPIRAIRIIEIAGGRNQERVKAAIRRARANQPVDWICECTVSPSAFFT